MNDDADNKFNADQDSKTDNLLKDLRDHYGYDQMNDDDKARYDTAIDKVMSQYRLDTSDDETGDGAEAQSGKDFDMGMESDEESREDELDNADDNVYEQESEINQEEPEQEEAEYTEEDAELGHGRRM